MTKTKETSVPLGQCYLKRLRQFKCHMGWHKILETMRLMEPWAKTCLYCGESFGVSGLFDVAANAGREEGITMATKKMRFEVFLLLTD